jgi:uncharacterized repeat protein (TIGR03803 family)
MLAGCGGGSGTPLNPSPAGLTAERPHVRPAETLFYSFKGGSGDGEDPVADLINVNSTLYGTTAGGGAKGDGTVFSITRSGTETMLHSFAGGSGDGASPQAGLVEVKGKLYGTTTSGGATGEGTVFVISTGGMETVLYGFAGGSGDGAAPFAGLINVSGKLYGTTSAGGANGEGTVFKITRSGRETVLHSFGKGTDGQEPLAGLLDVKGTLYGTTEGGGTYGDGTAFSISTGGTEKVLHSFGNGTDGIEPYAGLIDVKGTLYGTTLFGGAGCSYCRGTVFKITTSGNETVFYTFKGYGDGADPEAGVISVNGALYGTTFEGGANNDGTVVKIAPSGAETVLHSFAGGSGDGLFPYAGLINVNGVLYGTTAGGGAGCGSYGCGTVFSLSP